MAEPDVAVLLAAANRLEALAARTTGGSWEVRGLLASRPEVVVGGVWMSTVKKP